MWSVLFQRKMDIFLDYLKIFKFLQQAISMVTCIDWFFVAWGRYNKHCYLKTCSELQVFWTKIVVFGSKTKSFFVTAIFLISILKSWSVFSLKDDTVLIADTTLRVHAKMIPRQKDPCTVFFLSFDLAGYELIRYRSC